jgi:hypothetical protein
MPETFRGRWRVTVTGREAGFDQRVVISGSTNADGPHPGVVGHSFVVEGRAPWELRIEHNDGTAWSDSLVRRVGRVRSGVTLRWTIESEDVPESDPKDWNDLVLSVATDGPIIEIPVRPYAIEPQSLQMMPDGIFESALGRYFMGVQVANIWGEAFVPGQYVDVSAHGRAVLAAQGVQVEDAWTSAELQTLGQTLHGTGVVIGALAPFDSTTVYFKITCAGARPNKPTVELACLEPATMPDPTSPRRKAFRSIFVSRSYVDPVTHEMVAEAPEGRVRLALREAIVDTNMGRKGRRRRPVTRGGPSRPLPTTEELRGLLQQLLRGRPVDVCTIRRVLECYCEGREVLDGKDDPRQPGDRRFVYDPFLVLPTKFSYTVQGTPFVGQFGPLPFQDPWWKVLLAIAALVLLVAGMISEGADLAYHDEDLVIGSLEEWQQNDLDAALTKLNGSRSLPGPLLQYLDAQSGEVSTVPFEPVGAPALGGDISIPIPGFMTRAEIDAALASGDREQRRVIKSGARTGLTHALMSGFTTFTRDDDGTVFSIDQLRFVRDPDNDMPINRKGDSGSVWIHKQTLKLVALHHSGSADESGDAGFGSLIEDIVTRMGITFS